MHCCTRGKLTSLIILLVAFGSISPNLNRGPAIEMLDIRLWVLDPCKYAIALSLLSVLWITDTFIGLTSIEVSLIG